MRLWPIFASGQHLIDDAKSLIPRCLTEAQRQTHHLAPTPPGWCDTLQKWPNDGWSVAQGHIRAGRLREALASYAKVVAHDPSHAPALAEPMASLHEGLAWQAYLEVELKGQPSTGLAEVLSDADKAVALKPNDPSILDTRAQIFLALGRLDEALADFYSAITKGAKFPGAFYGRGRAHELKGNTTAAIADYRKALEFEFGDDDYERHVQTQLRARLKALGVEVPEMKAQPK